MKKAMGKGRSLRAAAGRIAFNRQGKIRLVFVLLGSLIAYAVVMLGVYALYWRGYNALMALWGITQKNIGRAPWFVQTLTRWSGVIVTLIQHGLIILLARLLMRAEKIERHTRQKDAKALLRGLAGGFLLLTLVWAALLLSDNMRLGWSLAKPVWSVNTPAILVSAAVSVAAELCFALGFLYRMLKARLNGRLALALYALVYAALCCASGSLTVMLAVNHLLTAVLCALLYEKSGSLACAFGFRLSWLFMGQAVFGFPGCAAALYETYPVNHYWLNGGSGGLMNGAAAGIALAVGIILIILSERRKSAA